MSENIIDKLVDRAPLAIVVIGVFVFIIGAAGGLPVGNPPLQITDPTWRIGLGVLGILLATAGLLLQFREVDKRTRSPNRVHKYSGTWIVQSSFSRWRGRAITEPDKVSFNGKALLLIPIDGEGGAGVQIGRLQVRVENYSATYEIVNEIQRASVDKDGTLRMQFKAIQLQLTEEHPPTSENAHAKDPYADLRGHLENLTFPLVAKPVADMLPLRLEGSHEHEEALHKDNIASEKWIYAGLFGPPGL